MSKYKVGDKVKVREDLVGGKIYEGQSAVSDMVEFKGKEVTIERTSCSGNDGYRIKELGYTWTNEMFEGLVDEEVKSDFKVGNKIEVISIDDIDEERNIKIGNTANIISSKENDSFSREYNCVFVKFINDDRIIKREIDDYDTEGCMLFTNQIKLVEDFTEEPNTSIEPTQSIPNKGTIKYRITDDGITYTTLGHNSGKSVKSGKDEADNKIGILIATCRLLNISENKISDIIDILFDNEDTKAKYGCENAVMKNDIARALSILDKYKEMK